MNIVRVALDLPLPRLFDYLAPDSDESDIGRRVTVPFGTASRTGVIIALVQASEQPDAKLKTVTAILRDMPALPADWRELCEFCARYYQTPLGEVDKKALRLLTYSQKSAKPRSSRKIPGTFQCICLTSCF